MKMNYHSNETILKQRKMLDGEQINRRLKAVTANYGPTIRFSFLMFVLSLAFLIAYYN